MGRGYRSGFSSSWAVWLTSALLTTAICFPLYRGYLLHRDAVATPRAPLTAAAFGIDGAPPRAVPQDGAMAVATQLADGGALLVTILALSVLFAGIGYGRLAQRLVPRSGTAGAVVAAIVGIWNPFVAERLLQGHWSLLAGYAMLGWIVCAALDVDRRRGWAPWAALIGLFAVAGFTPTGSVLALIMALVCAAPRRLAGIFAAWAVTASPWLVASVVGGSGASAVGGAQAFAARAEPGLGTLGAVLGLGGIWNADAVPASRTTMWALVATACLVAVVAAGSAALWRQRDERRRTIRALGIAAISTVVLVALAATGLGVAVLDALLTHVPGAGLLRDTQKYLALAVPFVAVAAAAAAGGLRRWVPGFFAGGAIALLLVAPLPDLAAGVGGRLDPIEYPGDYQQVTALIGASDRAVVVVPTTPMRNYSWNNAPSLSPLPRMLDAPVVMDGELTVDGQSVDGAATVQGSQVLGAVRRGGDPAALASLGVGWVVIEGAEGSGSSAPPLVAERAPAIYQGSNLTVFRIDGAALYPQASTAAWIATLAAHSLWALCLVIGLAAASPSTTMVLVRRVLIVGRATRYRRS